MAPKKGKESPLQLCRGATASGNSISVRMLEYLSTAKNQPHNFRLLANDFLDICRILYSIEAGLTEISHTHGQIPVDMIEELDKRFRQVSDDFFVLNQMLVKFLECETKAGIGRLQKGWRMMFADTNIDKMRETLTKNREALKMSAMVFRWSVGDEKADASIGVGCTALAAILGHVNNQDKLTAANPPMHTPPVEPPELPLPLPPAPAASMERMSVPTRDLGSRKDDSLTALPGSPGRQSSTATPRTRTSKLQTTSPVMWKNGSSVTESILKDNASEKTVAMTAIEDMIHEISLTKTAPRIQEIEVNDIDSNQVLRLKADPTTVPRWTPRQRSGENSVAMQAALKNAIQQGKHKMIEQLLDCGVPPEGDAEVKHLREAVLNRDIETVRLLLLFGADPNGIDGNGFTPLLSATEISFLEAAKILVKYGADPNLPAGLHGESPFVMSVTENRMEFAQLYLTYGGDANGATVDGNTVLVKAMNETTQKNLVELMLSCGADPNGKNREGVSPLFAAIQAARIDLMTALLDRGADPNLPGPKHLLWPATYQPKALQLLLDHGADYNKCSGIMELATSINNKDSVSILLDAGVDPNAKKDGTYTPLCTAIRDNRSDLVALLLANNADPNLMASEYPAFKCVTHHRTHLLPQLIVAGSDLHTPKGILEKAVAHNNKEALLYLLEQGVSPNDRTVEGNTPLTTAIRDNHSDFVDTLLAHGANPSTRGQDWPICMAVKRPEILSKLLSRISNPHAIPKGTMEMAVVANELESIKLLLHAGVSVEDKNGGVFSPLTTAIREDRKDIVQFLLDEAGADVNAPGEHLPIIKAIRRCRAGDYAIIEILLDRGADINLMYRGWNAVLQAAENGDANVLRLLVNRGGDIDFDAADESGRTVMDIVNTGGWQEGVEIFQDERRRLSSG